MLDTTVKIFSSDQSGAPSLTNAAGSLIALLDACLVNGFGVKTCDSVTIASGVGTANISTGHSAIEDGVVLFAGATGTLSALNGERKVSAVGTNTIVFDASDLADGTVSGTITVKIAAAGWAKPFSGTNLAAYKSGNVQASGAYLRVDDTTTTYASVRGYMAMTDVNSGTDQFPLVAQQATAVWPKSDAASARKWWIVANDRMIYLGVAYFNAYQTIVTPLNCFGDFISRKAGDAYRAVLSSVMTTNPSSGSAYAIGAINASAGNGASASVYCPRSYSALGSPVSLLTHWFDRSANTNGVSGYGGRLFPNPSDNGISFAPVALTEGNGYRGELPGIYATSQAIGGGVADGQRLADVPGYSGALCYKQLMHSNGNVGGMFFDLTGPWGN